MPQFYEELRESLRCERRGLQDSDQLAAAKGAADMLSDWLGSSCLGTAASYVATDGELSPQVIVTELRANNWVVAYPRIDNESLLFFRVAEEEQLRPSRFNLMEPAKGGVLIPPTELDIVLTPLVGFDARRRRMGRGGGFYDRTFAFLNSSNRQKGPLLIGLAHDLQLISRLPSRPQDVPLDAVVTPSKIYGRLPV